MVFLQYLPTLMITEKKKGRKKERRLRDYFLLLHYVTDITSNSILLLGRDLLPWHQNKVFHTNKFFFQFIAESVSSKALKMPKESLWILLLLISLFCFCGHTNQFQCQKCPCSDKFWQYMWTVSNYMHTYCLVLVLTDRVWSEGPVRVMTVGSTFVPCFIR